MKKHALSALFLLLCTVLLCVSCTRVLPEGKDTDTNGNTSTVPETQEPINPQNIIGKWYSERNAQVMQFFSDGKLKVFNLAPGYFEYQTVVEGTYSYDGTTLSYQFSSGDGEAVPCTLTSTSLRIQTASYQLDFAPVEVLPEQHAQYDFPDYDALAKQYALPSSLQLTGNTVSTDLRLAVISEIQQSWWSTKSKDEWVKLTEGVAQKGNYVNIDYTGYMNGEPFSGGSDRGKDLTALDNGQFVPGFAEGIVGHAVGETFDVILTFPDNYHEGLAGKEVTFRMTLNCIYDLPVTDENAVSKGYQSFEDWVETEYLEHLQDEVWNLIPGLTDADIPEEAYLYFLQINRDRFHEMAFSYGYDYAQFLAMVGLSDAAIVAQCKEFGRVYLQVAQVVAKYELTADEELTAKVREEVLNDYIKNGYTREEAEKLLETDAKNDFRITLLTELATDYLIQNNTFVPKSDTTAE